MSYAAKIILHTPLANPAQLASFVETCLTDGVVLIAIIGIDACRVEDVIDELVVRDGSNSTRFIATTSHPKDTIEDVLNFVSLYDAGSGAQIERVRL
jgi:hypothetical protein